MIEFFFFFYYDNVYTGDWSEQLRDCTRYWHCTLAAAAAQPRAVRSCAPSSNCTWDAAAAQRCGGPWCKSPSRRTWRVAKRSAPVPPRPKGRGVKFTRREQHTVVGRFVPAWFLFAVARVEYSLLRLAATATRARDCHSHETALARALIDLLMTRNRVPFAACRFHQQESAAVLRRSPRPPKA